jgi:hypothetical protein
VYVRLFSFIDGEAKYYDYAYTTTNTSGCTPPTAQMITPAPASTLTSSTVTFQWTGGTGVSSYRLEVGSATDIHLYYNQELTGLSAAVSNLPTNGTFVYVKLWSQINGSWFFNGYTFTAVAGGPAKAQMATPAPSSTLTSSTVTFQWTGGTGVTDYWLTVGLAPGAQEFYSAGPTNLSATISGLPTDGSTVFARLWSKLAGAWQYNDYTYTASSLASGKAQITTPAPSSTLMSSTVTFQWTGGTGVTDYWLTVGLAPGAQEFYSAGPTNLTATISGLPTDGSTVYARLWSKLAAGWQYNDYTYTASALASAKAQMTTPAPSSTLTSSTVTFQWTGGTGVTDYWLELGSAANAQQYYNQGPTSLSATVSTLPTDGSTVYVRLWSKINGAWLSNSYTYTASSIPSGRAQMTAPAPSSTLTSSTVTFQWTGGTGVTDYWLTMGSAPGAQEFYSQGPTSLSATVSMLPTNGSTVYVRLWSKLAAGWEYNDYTYTALMSAPAKAQMTTPAPSSTLTSSTVMFQWTGGTGVSEYWITVGSTAGGQEFYSLGLTGLSATASALPTNGSTVYVRLWSRLDAGWQYNDYTYTASH